MPGFDASALVVEFNDEDNTLAVYKNVMVQVRTGQMTLPVVARIAVAARTMRTKKPGKLGLLAVLEAGAEIASAEVRAAQQRNLRELMAGGDNYSVGFMADDGIKARLLRSFTRMLILGNKRFHIAKDASDASVWLSNVLGSPPSEELLAVVQHVRGLARDAAAG